MNTLCHLGLQNLDNQTARRFPALVSVCGPVLLHVAGVEVQLVEDHVAVRLHGEAELAVGGEEVAVGRGDGFACHQLILCGNKYVHVEGGAKFC